MRRFLSLVRRTLMASWLHLRVWIALAIGQTGSARGHLLRLVTLAPASFRAHFLLGRIAMAERRDQDACQEFAICHRLNPDRFLRQLLPAPLIEEVTARCLTYPESPMFGLPHADAESLPGEWDDLFAHDMDRGPWSTDAPPIGSDFIDGEEYRRLRTLPPIDASDLESVDMDALLARLVESPHPGETQDQG